MLTPSYKHNTWHKRTPNENKKYQESAREMSREELEAWEEQQNQADRDWCAFLFFIKYN